MSTEEQETLLQTIRARLEWNEKGEVSWFADETGKWSIAAVKEKPNSGLVRYFEPAYAIGVDVYGNT